MVTVKGRKFILMEGKLEKIAHETRVPPGYVPSFSPAIAFSRLTSRLRYVPKGYQLQIGERICKFQFSDVVYIKYSE